MKQILFALFLLCSITASSQKVEMWLDSNFRHVKSKPYYYAVNEERGDSGWFLQAWYVKDKSLAIEAWVEDEKAKSLHGKYASFFPNRNLKTAGEFVYGKKEGPWVTYNIDGIMTDSSNYYDGILTGVQMKFHSNGIPSDSIFYISGDHATVVQWNEEGYLTAAGLMDDKGKKSNIWKYYNNNGMIIGSEHFSKGERVKIICYDDQGKQMPDDKCADQEVEFPGGELGWFNHFEKVFRESRLTFNGMQPGRYTAKAEFTLDEKGNLSDIKILSKVGYEMEDELKRVLEKSPQWRPAIFWGRPQVTKMKLTLYYDLTENYQHFAVCEFKILR